MLLWRMPMNSAWPLGSFWAPWSICLYGSLLRRDKGARPPLWDPRDPGMEQCLRCWGAVPFLLTKWCFSHFLSWSSGRTWGRNAQKSWFLQTVAEQLQCAWEMLALLWGVGSLEWGICWGARGGHFISASPVTHTSLWASVLSPVKWGSYSSHPQLPPSRDIVAPPISKPGGTRSIGGWGCGLGCQPEEHRGKRWIRSPLLGMTKVTKLGDVPGSEDPQPGLTI